MLFDLRATGRRRAVKIVYVFLAFLIGGGLVLFGVGGSGFGLLNADQKNGSAGGGVSYEDQAAKAEKQALDPKRSAKAEALWAAAAKARFQAASAGFNTQAGAYSDQGVAQLKLAGDDWQQYLKVNNGKPDLILTKLMAQAYGSGALSQPTEAVRAWQIVVANESTGPNYALLALSAYLADNSKVADAAARQAIALTPKKQADTLRAQFNAAKAQAKAQKRAAAAQAAQQQSSPVAGLP